MIATAIRRFLPIRRTPVFRECRRCGTTLDSTVDRCPSCDADDIARYELPA